MTQKNSYIKHNHRFYPPQVQVVVGVRSFVKNVNILCNPDIC